MRKRLQKRAWGGIWAAALLAVFLAVPLVGSLHPRAAKAGSQAGAGVTHIAVTDTVLQPTVERLGINLGEQNYFDSGMMLKNLAARDPGFEGGSYQSILRCLHADAARCADDDTGSAWPQDFWRGAAYEWITGPLEGHKGSVKSSSAADHHSDGALLQLADASGATGGGLERAAGPSVASDREQRYAGRCDGGLVDRYTRRSDVDDGDEGPVSAYAGQTGVAHAGGRGSLRDGFGILRYMGGAQFSAAEGGRYRLSFRAKAVSGSALKVSLYRLSQPGVKFFDQDVPLEPRWQDMHIDFEAEGMR